MGVLGLGRWFKVLGVVGGSRLAAFGYWVG